jgi:hypothetical protein
MSVRKLILTFSLMALAASAAWGQRVSSITVPGLDGRQVTFPVYSVPGMNNIAKADIANGTILVNWQRLMRYQPSSQLIRLMLAHEAGHLLHQDLSAEREDRADYFAGRTLRIEGYTARDMAIVRQDMLRILGRGDSTHAPSAERVRITMQGYNSVVSRPARQTWNASSSYGAGGGWRRFGPNSLR